MRFLSTRDRGLDGLRAVAVGFVLLHHLLSHLTPGGIVGVDLFFVLSGYLITKTLVDEFDATGDILFGDFYLRRCARLMPALGLLLVAAVAIQLWLPDPFGWRAIAYCASYTINWARAFGWGDSPVLGHTWSLAVEEQFYLLWPPILLATLKWRRRSAICAAVAIALLSVACSIGLVLSGASWQRTYNGFDTRAVALLVGCAAAFVRLDGRLAGLLARLWPAPVIVFVAALGVTPQSPLLPLGGFGLLAVMGAWIVIAVRCAAPLVVVLRLPPMVYIGRISYGVYLWQFPLIALCRDLGLRPWAQAAVVLPLTLALAAASFHLVENPILLAARKRMAPRHPPIPAAPETDRIVAGDAS